MRLSTFIKLLISFIVIIVCLSNETITSAAINFVMAGVIPGTPLQLPWYIVMLCIPLLLFIAWRLVQSIDFSRSVTQKAPAETTNTVDKPKTKPKTAAKNSQKSSKATSRKKPAKKTATKLHGVRV